MFILDALAELFPDSTKSTRKRWIHAKQITLNGVIVHSTHTFVQKGDRLEKLPRKETLFQGFHLLHRDRFLLAISKPHGLLSVPKEKKKDSHNSVYSSLSGEKHAMQVLRNHLSLSQLFPVHRLDRESSGVMVFARTEDSKRRLKELFYRHDLQREYLAIVQGAMRGSRNSAEKNDRGKWESFLLENPLNYSVSSTRDQKRGKYALTHYEILHISRKMTYLRCILHTGRKHQIRVHCAEAGYPIVGDVRYGDGQKSSPWKRMCLHAHLLSFRHPFTEKQITFTSPPPHFFLPHLNNQQNIDESIER